MAWSNSCPRQSCTARIDRSDPLPPGQVWTISPGGNGAAPALYRLEVTVGPGGGVKILNAPVSPAFRESVHGEQNLYTRSKELVGDRDPGRMSSRCNCERWTRTRPGTALGWACWWRCAAR